MNDHALIAEPVEEELDSTMPIPFPPKRRQLSGLYRARTLAHPFGSPLGGSEDAADDMSVSEARPTPWPYPWRWPYTVEELRLDVDGYYPQMTASGTRVEASLPGRRIHWIAQLTAKGPNWWTGTIWYKDGDVALLPHSDVEIRVIHNPFRPATARVLFSGGGSGPRTVKFAYASAYFHPVEFEFDFEDGIAVTDAIDTWAHPNHPATLPNETLSIDTVFRRAGFQVRRSPGGPVSASGISGQWSDMEMHDAMQTYWSRFASTAQWAMWVFTASQHERGTGLGGIMFDDIGPNHRQGTALFTDSFISVPPTGDPNPAEWIQRMRFWTACHEMGHAFNLAHSWQKSLGAPYGSPWIPLADEPEARSFMNYPYGVAGGQSAFFADFEFRFGGMDQTPASFELLFMRHAPARFVQMGNADWFDNHGFEQANTSPEPALQLVLRVNREQPAFEFMEPVTLELKLTNASSQPQLIEENLLSASDSLTVILKKDGRPARQFVPYASYCRLNGQKVLMPGDSDYDSLYVSSGRNGWDIAEPGNYTIQIALRLHDEDIVSNPLRLRILPPFRYEEDVLAQDFFSDDVGRIMYFDGSQFFTSGNNTLREITERLAERRVALHAGIALGKPLTLNYKELIPDKGKMAIKTNNQEFDEAHRLLKKALLSQPKAAVESLGHIDYKYYTDYYSQWLASQDCVDDAVQAQNTLYKTLSTRQVHGRKILDRVLEQVQARRDSYKAMK